ncbi:MAG: class I SAM-dependent methyltransferase [Alphaproteobacteria bacterium]|nr:class I SAM-dependent methyltransferase [Alphaproteobacteria bacterium]
MAAVEDRMWWYRGLRALVTGELGRALDRTQAQGSILDAGCGTGGILTLLGPSFHGRPTMGLEYDSIAAEMARTKSGRPVMCASINDLPLPDGSLAAYYSLDVYSQIGVDPARALSEVRRCLVPGGVALLNLPAYQWMMSAHDKRTYNARRFTRGSALALARAQGFEPLRATYWNSLLFPAMAAHRLLERDDAPSDVREYPRWLDSLFSAALSLERGVIGAGLSFPFGGSILLVLSRRP